MPEISLTEQLISKVISRFGNKRLAVIHSYLKKEEKLYFWQRIINNEIDIVVGARSAVFAPLNNLGLIIVDEENDSSYKSSQSPRYNARQVAYMRARREKALMVLGSAAPSVETYYFALREKYKMFIMHERYNKNPLPEFHVIDLKESDEFNKKYPLTKSLINKVDENIKKNQQVMLFLNRRGFSNYLVCRNCGYIFKCEKCNISLTYHRIGDKLVCHYCGYKKNYPIKCENCNSKDLHQSGAGTQKIEYILNEIFKDKVISRLDLDVSRKKGKLKEIIADFEKNNINILTGTQIISKGLNFPNVTLVGILFIDDILNLPDFRASENVFDLIVQVSGRAGRDKLLGEVVIQTFVPEHFSIKYATEYRFNEFYKKELQLRKELNYPPFCRLVKITLEGRGLEMVIDTSKAVYSVLKKNISDEAVELLGPVSSPISKVKNKFRYQILVKTKKISNIKEGLNKVKRRYKTVNVIIDVDPVSLL